MFSDKKNVNILTSLLMCHGVRHAVVCPGSRNAPIVHNLNECSSIRCWPVTDERSAGFFALGLAQATRTPVVVCVTSGTALLNLAPAVAEAFYQHQPLIVVSADRPEAWIGQLDGQTLPQQGALGPFVKKAVSLPTEVVDETDEWYCNRLINEALLASRFLACGPVHINVPLKEPLFHFSVAHLPEQRVIHQRFCFGMECCLMVADWWMSASRPMLVVGQCDEELRPEDGELLRQARLLLSSRGVMLTERLTRFLMTGSLADEAIMAVGEDEQYMPDLIIYMGDTVVSKRLKMFLRRARTAKTVMLSLDGEVRDVTMHADEVVQIRSFGDFLCALAKKEQERLSLDTEKEMSPVVMSQKDYHSRWQRVFDRIGGLVEEYAPPFSQMTVIKYLEQQLEDWEDVFYMHVANSSAVRLANIYAGHFVYCNRGVNGIDGSLSTAVGFAAAVDEMVLCVIGDLSFFYDQNALWNAHLKGNFRMVLLNNSGGGIFRMLPGLETSTVRDGLVSGAHHTSAKGICEQNDVGYLHAENPESMRMGIITLLTEHTSRPMLLEVFTDAATDAEALKTFQQLVREGMYHIS